jgi:hypothetical protein
LATRCNRKHLVKVTSDATATMNGATKTFNLALTPENPENPGKNVFTLTSNSTVTQFAFDQIANN